MRRGDLISTLRRNQNKLRGYVAAALIFAIAIGVREIVDPYIKIPYVTLFPAMILCSLVGGRLAGILAAVFGGLIAWYLWLPPRFSFELDWPTGHLSVLLYIFTSTILLLTTRGLNESLSALEKERDLSAELFRELQHRTANNLQNISALLRQNRSEIEADPHLAFSTIDTAQRRFEIMSRINRRLYSPEMQEVEMTGYLDALCRDIQEATGSHQIICIVRPSPVKLDRERAMILSLLVSELMVNVSKHAFPNGEAGTVTMGLAAVGSDLIFSFSDNGKGLPDDYDLTRSVSLGSRIMEGLASQLLGSMRAVNGTSGTTVEITMPVRPRQDKRYVPGGVR